jgi:hypothetical protein
MRFRPANIRLINRRPNLPRLLLALSSKNGKSNDNHKNNPTVSRGLTGHSISDEEVVQKHIIQIIADFPQFSSGPALGLGIKSPSACQILNNMAKRFVDRNLLCRAAAFDLAPQHLTNLSDNVLIAD